MSVCVCVFLSVQAITVEHLDIETSFLLCRYIFIITRSNLSIKVISSRSRLYEKKLCEGHINVKEIYLHLFKFYVAHTVSKWVVCIRLKCILVYVALYWMNSPPVEQVCKLSGDYIHINNNSLCTTKIGYKKSEKDLYI